MSMRSALAGALAIAAVLVAASSAPAAITLTGVEQRVTAEPGDQYDPAIAGDIVVYTDYRAADTDVYYTDLTTGIEHPVIVAPGNQELTGVSGDRIVYTDYRTADVVLFDISTGTTTNLTAPDKDALGKLFNSVDPAIGGDLVAWQDNRNGDAEIYAKNVVTGEERRVTDSTDSDTEPSVGGTLIVWQRCVAAGVCSVYSYDWATTETRLIAAGAGVNFRNPSTDGGRVVYQSDEAGTNDICAYEVATLTTQCLTLAGEQANPHVSGDWVSFDDLTNGIYHTGLWYLPTGQSFDLDQLAGGPPSTAGQYLTGVDGNRVVFTDDRNGDLEIYMVTLQWQQVQQDTTPPTIVVPSTVVVDATGPDGAAATYPVTVTDGTDPAPSWSCVPASGSVFPIGDTTVTCTATDASGNSASAAFVVRVSGAAEQLAALRTEVAGLGLRPLVAATLDLELRAAQAALAAGRPKLACAALDLFTIEVRLIRPPAMPAADAADLISTAARIRAVIGCA